jgi:hypothetical protein
MPNLGFSLMIFIAYDRIIHASTTNEDDMQSKATHTTQFEARIRDEWICVEAQAWADQDGIYKQEITGVYLDGVNVTGLLTDYDLSELDAMIGDAITNETYGE